VNRNFMPDGEHVPVGCVWLVLCGAAVSTLLRSTPKEAIGTTPGTRARRRSRA
jgi:hypothetical protein